MTRYFKSNLENRTMVPLSIRVEVPRFVRSESSRPLASTQAKLEISHLQLTVRSPLFTPRSLHWDTLFDHA